MTALRYTFFLFLLGLPLLAQSSSSLEIYFSPEGGFAEKNKSRTLTLKDGSSVPATLSSTLCKKIGEVEAFGKIKMCMYSMGDPKVLNELLEAAEVRQIQVKLLLDACSSHSHERHLQLVKKVKETRERCEKEGRPFDFQVQFILPEKMSDRGRATVLKPKVAGDPEKFIYGSMHEKFGVFYGKDSPIPYDCFGGSANASLGSDTLYAENRVYFQNHPSVARQFQEEFARLWNEFGSPMEGRCVSEMLISVDPLPGDVEVIFNSEPLQEDRYYRIDEVLENLIEETETHLDLAMFSFTHYELAQTLLEMAEKRRRATFRILLDQTMMQETESRYGLAAPWLERQIKERGIKNLEIRYKWRSNAYGWNEKEKKVDILHAENLLMHHKALIINKKILANGSYNWSTSAEERNFENIMIFRKEYRDHPVVIDAFLLEFDTLWSALKSEGTTLIPLKRGTPQCISGEYGRKLQEKISTALSKEVNLLIVETLRKKYFLTPEELVELTALLPEELEPYIQELLEATLICENERKKEIGYALAD
jgi:phosphatidylserine/phosphatidylglycerophosphate/cardiolipin synthase-like enzyme